VSSYQYDLGLIIHVNTRLFAYEPDKEREITWVDSFANQISIGYGSDSNQLYMSANINGGYAFAETTHVATEEWNGSDGLWHDLSIELLGEEILGLIDDKIIFEFSGSQVGDMVNVGYLMLSGMSAIICYDDIEIISIYESPYLCGDANSDKVADVSDAVSIINYVFVGGNPPQPYQAGDANCDGPVDVSDAVWIISYVFTGGNRPCDTNGDGQPDC